MAQAARHLAVLADDLDVERAIADATPDRRK